MSVYGTDKRHHTLTVAGGEQVGGARPGGEPVQRRGYNIFSLAVAPSDNPRFSRITIVVDVESAPLDQIMKQLDKLIPVVSIRELDPTHARERELLLATVEAGARRADRSSSWSACSRGRSSTSGPSS